MSFFPVCSRFFFVFNFQKFNYNVSWHKFVFILFRFIQFLESVICVFLSIQGNRVETNFYKGLPVAILCGIDPQDSNYPWPVCRSRVYIFPETVHGPSLGLPHPPLGPRWHLCRYVLSFSCSSFLEDFNTPLGGWMLRHMMLHFTSNSDKLPFNSFSKKITSNSLLTDIYQELAGDKFWLEGMAWTTYTHAAQLILLYIFNPFDKHSQAHL